MSIANAFILLFSLILILGVKTSECATSNETKTLLTELFTTNNYNTIVRPVLNQSKPVVVQVGLTLVGLTDLDEVAGKLITRGYLEIIWTDEHLVWDPNNFGEIQYMNIPQNQIWKPDIHLKNGYSHFSYLGGSFLLVKVSYDGQVLWYPFEILDTTCRIDISRFPFDIQSCKIAFIAWSSGIQDIKLASGNFTLEGTIHNSEWEIIDTSKDTSMFNGEPVINFHLRLKRKPLFIVLNIIIPVVFLSFLDIMVFVLPADSGEKMGYSVTLFLAFIVFLTIVSSVLPDTSDTISLLGIYLMFQMCMSTVIVLVTTIQLRLNFRNPEIKVRGIWLKLVHLSKFLHIWSWWITRSKVNEKTNTTVDTLSIASDMESKDKKPDSVVEHEALNDKLTNATWGDVCSALDFLCFLIISFMQLISTIIFIAVGVS